MGYKYGQVRELIFSGLDFPSASPMGVGTNFGSEQEQFCIVMALNYGLINLRITTSGELYISAANGTVLPADTYKLFGSCIYLH